MTRAQENRVFNFSAGPAMLPVEVLERASEDMLDWNGSGMSVMEMSHRGKEYVSIAEKAEADFRTLMGVPDNYKVLFLQGGASAQFSMVPMNLLRGKTHADYLNTGHWSEKAVAEGKRYCKVNIVADTKGSKYTTLPDASELSFSKDAAYVHYTPNETIAGVEFGYIPETGDIPLVADMSSTILSRPVDVSRFGVIYAGAQKNIGPAGLCIAIVRDDLIGETLPGTPVMFDYKTHADNGSMYNTPPTYAWYIAGLVFEHLLAKGGLAAMEAINQRKAQKLYDVIDNSPFYSNPVDTTCRSWMNVPFLLNDSALDKAFLKEAEAAALTSLAGHRSVGGMRASIYNAMPEAGVDALVEFMNDFARRNG
ncbi:MAG: 3-phosphoserine/phosphohydroxythreonine transaminase [Halothiobacillaceae bacterium]|nr:MAG: 3-phosphoserine/phosphohydroxythreonine transaminase [Halothiobacillaceae bacterium]